MPMRTWISLTPDCYYAIPINDEEEEGGEYLFDPEAGRASDNPFAHLKAEESPDDSADSGKEVSKYVGGTEEE
tara:strand:+ start:473 stop:691 length:219 start_codon:yes stop_codon:yes gene_type:complete